jgi:NAD(P)-dependent dehydrogenase (short-subunit alcohol dehydrogenase family)
MWLEEHPDKAGYAGSKQAVSTYVSFKASTFLRDHGVRLNATAPGPTDPHLARANADRWLTFASDYRTHVGIEASTPQEQAHPLLFLCSPAASHVNGVVLTVDGGYVGAGITGAFLAPMVNERLGR